LTYVSIDESSSYRFFSSEFSYTNESEKILITYLPIGFRLNPKKEAGFMLKFNVGPLWNHSAPNMLTTDKTLFWVGLDLGYSFNSYKERRKIEI
jgi:hypothetical protein